MAMASGRPPSSEVRRPKSVVRSHINSDFVDVKYLDLQFVFSASGSQISSGYSLSLPFAFRSRIVFLIDGYQ
ncbi:hypothetical protein L1987_53148 [Smallanthus sonchifolius]|uniref:Uncharacterized protein n=1 Tax=Smallanthus sonchifolius TaxID=185202 RepID=A0ACB9EV32_9ASTR|nr:hypothetical protein L1987_53148 [Smallanthus sonchifolius]